MNRCTRAGGRRCAFTALILSSALTAGLATVARATVTPTYQLRDVMTFASLLTQEGGPTLFESHQDGAPGYDPFTQTVESFVSDPVAGWAHSWATQTSTVGPGGMTAEGSFMGEASLGGEAPFGEAFGSSRSFFHFDVDVPTPYVLAGNGEAAGNGRLTLSFFREGVATILYRSFQDDAQTFDQSGVLDPGSYSFEILSGGYGQAIASSGVVPASGSYRVQLVLDAATSVPVVSLPDGARLAVHPNPVHAGTTISLRGSAEGSASPGGNVAVFDATGRRIRELGCLGAGSLTWDARDDRGGRVSPGIYFVRLPGVEPARVVVTP